MKARYSLVVSWIVLVAANGCGGDDPLESEGGGGSSSDVGAGESSGSAGSVGTTTSSGTSAGSAGAGASSATAGSGSGSGGAAAGSGSGGAGAGGAGAGGAGAGGAGAGGAGAGGGDDVSAVCPGGPYAANPLPANGRPQLVRGGFTYVEGPVWVAELGALFFSEINMQSQNTPPLNGPKAKIQKLTPPGTIEVFLENSGTNGLGLHSDGNLIACTHDTRSISVFDLGTKARREVAGSYMGKRFSSPNDVVARSDGNVYFTDPDFQLSAGRPELPTAAYRVSPSGAVSLIGTLETPNGVALSPDESVLYVTEFTPGRIRRYPLSAEGAPGASSDFAANLPKADGMGVDCAGNIYIAWRDGMDVLAPSGARLGSITGMGEVSNVAFGGADRKTLYITAGASLYAMEMNIPGYPN
ncbi:SMP-30/gluconolactonase/LRE family protein [Sorangium atrum]|uniref:SMP-30/gluconolactonase/LRE family protein n=1 Tax=Sorangium atrum TaxID=2995308 RepID=A0ABT5CC20_9BACT|nr:SMP-30/gluconolactonase/LRE family protein [Sorangium aterium]MDC0683365.1 SMP-30/gluconolactonase/LRE family protein [Sorangium aterium]